MENKIYMVSKTGAVWFSTNTPAKVIEELKKAGFRECTVEEFRAKRQEQQKEDKPEVL